MTPSDPDGLRVAFLVLEALERLGVRARRISLRPAVWLLLPGPDRRLG